MTMLDKQGAAKSRAKFYGVHHLALNTDDMKKTVDFYSGVLGMQLIHAMKVPPGIGVGPNNRGNPPYEEIRHYFFDMGRDALLGFFEMPKGEEKTGNRNDLGAMQHVSFSVSPSTFEDIQARLKNAILDFDGPWEVLPGVHSIYVIDPNNTRIEFSCQPADGEGEPGIVAGSKQTAEVALQELRTLTDDEKWLAKAVAHLE